MAAIKKWVAATITIYIGSVLGVFIIDWLQPEPTANNLDRIAVYSGITAVFLLLEAIIAIFLVKRHSAH